MTTALIEHLETEIKLWDAQIKAGNDTIARLRRELENTLAKNERFAALLAEANTYISNAKEPTP